MTNITAGMVKDLREKTGAGMMDCKAALTENQGDMEASIDWLRKKGLAKAAKKAGRIAADGLIGVATEKGRGAMVEVNSETDFVARGEEFQNFVRKAAQRALQEEGNLERLLANAFDGSASGAEVLQNLIAKIGENMNVRRSAALNVAPGIVASYVHTPVAAGAPMGRIGVLVALESTADASKLTALGKDLAMHVAFANPDSLDVAGLDPHTVARERAIHADTARQSGKPENVIEKMVDGRMRKYYEEKVLLSQLFIKDEEKKSNVGQVLERAGKDLGAPVRIAGYVRFAVGEGIEKPTEDFASEVKSMGAR
jgi:elongation factor Ts